MEFHSEPATAWLSKRDKLEDGIILITRKQAIRGFDLSDALIRALVL
jgi:hypothetical protein